MGLFSREMKDLLQQYQALVIKWNRAINLVSKNTIDEFWDRHILDSLQLLKYIDDKKIKLIDVGSGGGLPGIVLSIAGIKETVLVESDVRKSIFLYQASKISTNEIRVINRRIEEITDSCDILTCRAFSSLNLIFANSQHIKVNDKYLLLKGKNYKEELKEAQKYWFFNYYVYNSITSPEGKILEISNLVKIK